MFRRFLKETKQKSISFSLHLIGFQEKTFGNDRNCNGFSVLVFLKTKSDEIMMVIVTVWRFPAQKQWKSLIIIKFTSKVQQKKNAKTVGFYRPKSERVSESFVSLCNSRVRKWKKRKRKQLQNIAFLRSAKKKLPEPRE